MICQRPASDGDLHSSDFVPAGSLRCIFWNSSFERLGASSWRRGCVCASSVADVWRTAACVPIWSGTATLSDSYVSPSCFGSVLHDLGSRARFSCTGASSGCVKCGSTAVFPTALCRCHVNTLLAQQLMPYPQRYSALCSCCGQHAGPPCHHLTGYCYGGVRYILLLPPPPPHMDVATTLS